MKTKILIAFLALSLFSCKDKKEDQNNNNPGAVEETINPNFRVEINALASKKDDFALYFTEDNTINFSGENTVWGAIEPAKESTINFEIPDERLPTHIRLDFGLNKEQDSVVIKNIKLNYLENSFEIKGSELLNYFSKNDEIKTKIDSVNNTFIIYKEGIEYKTPFYYPNENLVVKLRELTGVPAKTQNVQQ